MTIAQCLRKRVCLEKSLVSPSQTCLCSQLGRPTPGTDPLNSVWKIDQSTGLSWGGLPMKMHPPSISSCTLQVRWTPDKQEVPGATPPSPNPLLPPSRSPRVAAPHRVAPGDHGAIALQRAEGREGRLGSAGPIRQRHRRSPVGPGGAPVVPEEDRCIQLEGIYKGCEVVYKRRWLLKDGRFEKFNKTSKFNLEMA